MRREEQFWKLGDCDWILVCDMLGLKFEQPLKPLGNLEVFAGGW